MTNEILILGIVALAIAACVIMGVTRGDQSPRTGNGPRPDGVDRRDVRRGNVGGNAHYRRFDTRSDD